jgi:hypothetical protein
MEHTDLLTSRQKSFLKRLREAKQRLHECLRGLTPLVMSSQPVEGYWTIKDILIHLIAWNAEFRSNITDIISGCHPGYDHQISVEADFSAWNQAQVDKHRDLTLEHILAKVEQDYTEAETMIRSLRPDQYKMRGVTPWKPAAISRPENPGSDDTDSVSTLVTFHWRHINAHCKQIERWRKKGGGESQGKDHA